MITSLQIYESTGFNPYHNIAAEKYLMDMTGPSSCLLYLWQNQNTVVIGHNQNAWAECRTSLLQEEGGHLARRLSGGGAVFHDLGNLNFTFAMCKENYDLERQLEVIRQACLLAGIHAEKSGRNDILADGRKFSGNAFYSNKTHAYHHGTLLVDVDTDKLQRYLSPPKAKLEAKGISSVRSRIVNLKELCPGLTIDRMKQYMCQAFQKVYGLDADWLHLSPQDECAIQELSEKYADWDYVYGAPLPFTVSCQGHFSWGHLEIQLAVKSGRIQSAKVFSDAMDWEAPAFLEQAMAGTVFSPTAVSRAITESAGKEYAPDIISLVEQELFR